ncbi:MAG TPA: hypothetical protein VN613_07520, partial [Gemmatimonadaceae bacterium]|nr:hypothetical protein [Gemmatimonadaceae bacterium]
MILALGHPAGATRPARDSARAHELARAGLEREALLDVDSALALYRAARRADSTDIVAEFRYIAMRRQRFEYRVLRDEYGPSEARWSPRGTACLAPLVTAVIEVREAAPRGSLSDDSGDAAPCTSALAALDLPSSGSTPLSTRLAMGDRATRALPGIPDLWISYAMLLHDAGDMQRAEDVWRRGEAAVGSPLLRMKVGMYHASELMQAGDTAAARSLQRGLRNIALRDGRRGVVAGYYTWALTTPNLSDDDGGPMQVMARLLGLCGSPGGWGLAADALMREGKALIDGGQPLRAIPLLSRAVAIGDSARVSDLQLTALTLRGRAYTKAGRPADAERDLLRALAAGKTAARVWYRADAYHNIGHAYESEGRWTDAVRAIDTFTAMARQMQYGPEVTGLLDAAEISWKAGWHASADVDFRRMVHAIDSTQGNYYYAGEYFERKGDL